MANGQVGTGFSKPYVALYSATTTQGVTTVSYTSGQILARGVSVNVSPDTSDDNNFYADNQTAETAAGVFGGGTVELVVDGLLPAAEKLIMGLPAAAEDGFTHYGESQQIPDVGIGFIRRVMNDGVTSYIPYILPRVRFNPISTEAQTQEDEISWQTQSLTAQILREESENHDWKCVGTAVATEAAAEAAIRTALDIA